MHSFSFFTQLNDRPAKTPNFYNHCFQMKNFLLFNLRISIQKFKNIYLITVVLKNLDDWQLWNGNTHWMSYDQLKPHKSTIFLTNWYCIILPERPKSYTRLAIRPSQSETIFKQNYRVSTKPLYSFKLILQTQMYRYMYGN